MTDAFAQRDQPPGVPPLRLTGERTLPDVPAENYWFRRHLAVYEWIAERAWNRRVVDLACGEGYGSQVLSRTAQTVVGVDTDAETFEHAQARYGGPGVAFERDRLETWSGDVDCVVFLQTIEHVEDPGAVLDRLRRMVGPGGICFVSTPNVRTLAGPGATKSGNPFHLREYTAPEFRELCAQHFAGVDVYGLFHANKLAWHALALKLGWDRVHRLLRITEPFYRRFTPAISASDFRLRHESDADLGRALDFVAVLRP